MISNSLSHMARACSKNLGVCVVILFLGVAMDSTWWPFPSEILLISWNLWGHMGPDFRISSVQPVPSVKSLICLACIPNQHPSVAYGKWVRVVFLAGDMSLLNQKSPVRDFLPSYRWAMWNAVSRSLEELSLHYWDLSCLNLSLIRCVHFLCSDHMCLTKA